MHKFVVEASWWWLYNTCKR